MLLILFLTFIIERLFFNFANSEATYSPNIVYSDLLLVKSFRAEHKAKASTVSIFFLLRVFKEVVTWECSSFKFSPILVVF